MPFRKSAHFEEVGVVHVASDVHRNTTKRRWPVYKSHPGAVMLISSPCTRSVMRMKTPGQSMGV